MPSHFVYYRNSFDKKPASRVFYNFISKNSLLSPNIKTVDISGIIKQQMILPSSIKIIPSVAIYDDNHNILSVYPSSQIQMFLNTLYNKLLMQKQQLPLDQKIQYQIQKQQFNNEMPMGVKKPASIPDNFDPEEFGNYVSISGNKPPLYKYGENDEMINLVRQNHNFINTKDGSYPNPIDAPKK